MEKNYFGVEEENAVKLYLSETDEYKKNLIYETMLKKPLHKMAEALINRYKLHLVSVDIDTQIYDGLSFLQTKMSKFDAGLNKKAYSYYGTTLKHYFLGEKRREDGQKIRHADYDVLFPIICEDEKYSYTIEEVEEMDKRSDIKSMVDDIISVETNEHIISIGLAIVAYLEECSKYDCNRNVNRNTWLEFVRGFTKLSDKEIREGVKKYKNVYSRLCR